MHDVRPVRADCRTAHSPVRVRPVDGDNAIGGLGRMSKKSKAVRKTAKKAKKAAKKARKEDEKVDTSSVPLKSPFST